MKLKPIIFLLILVTLNNVLTEISSNTVTHNCVHDIIHRESAIPLTQFQNYNTIPIENVNRELKTVPPSNLTYTSNTTAPIRICPDYSNLINDITYSCTQSGNEIKVGNPPTTTTYCDCTSSATLCTDCYYTCTPVDVLSNITTAYIISMISQVVTKFAATLSLNPVQGNLTFPTFNQNVEQFGLYNGYGGPLQIPPIYTSPGVPGCDIIIFISARPTTTLLNTLGYADSFIYDQYNRPIAGQINFGPNSVNTDPLSFIQKNQFYVFLHEATHALGMTKTRLDSLKVAVPTEFPNGTATIQYIINTPTVLQAVREQFGCPTALGAEIENSGPNITLGSHWAKRVFYDEYMTGTPTLTPSFSNITLAFLHDLNFYSVNFAEAEFLDWGYDVGCDFLNYTYLCNVSVAPNLWCPQGSSPGLCTFNRYATGECTTEPLSDTCTLYVPYGTGDCRDPANSPAEVDVLGETFGASSRCYVMSLLQSNSTVTFPSRLAGCLRTKCTGNDYLFIQWNDDNFYYCPKDGQLEFGGYNGNVQCGNSEDICYGTSDDLLYPIVESVDPAIASYTGGILVTITGIQFKIGNFYPQVKFVGSDATYDCIDMQFDITGTNITCRSPAIPNLQDYYEAPIVVTGMGDRSSAIRFRVAGYSVSTASLPTVNILALLCVLVFSRLAILLA